MDLPVTSTGKLFTIVKTHTDDVKTDLAVMPPFLMDGEGENLKDGLNMGSPSIIVRFKKLLDWVIPLCRQYGVWGLALANEPETMFKDHPEEAEGLLHFLRASREHVHSLYPELAVTVT